MSGYVNLVFTIGVTAKRCQWNRFRELAKTPPEHIMYPSQIFDIHPNHRVYRERSLNELVHLEFRRCCASRLLKIHNAAPGFFRLEYCNFHELTVDRNDQCEVRTSPRLGIITLAVLT